MTLLLWYNAHFLKIKRPRNMSEEKFDFGAMVSAQMKTFRPGFKFPKSFNDFKNVESDPEKRKAELKAASGEVEEVSDGAEMKNPLDMSIQAAFESGDPIEGKVEKEVKGGYEVMVRGQRAFCPFSQIDRYRKPGAVYVGETFLFQVQEYGADDRGVNLIVSRRAELELEQQALKDELRNTLEEGQTLNGQSAAYSRRREYAHTMMDARTPSSSSSANATM